MRLHAILLAALIARYWREPRTRIGWTHLQWLGLLTLLVVLGQIGAYVAKLNMVSRGAQAGSLVSIIFGIGILAGVVIWLVGALVLTLKKRHSLPPEDRLSASRSFLRGLRGLILPTLAALVLLCMPATYAIERNLDRMGERHRQLAINGEVESYGFQTDGTNAEGGD